jgi:hypothetical protein
MTPRIPRSHFQNQPKSSHAGQVRRLHRREARARRHCSPEEEVFFTCVSNFPKNVFVLICVIPVIFLLLCVEERRVDFHGIRYKNEWSADGRLAFCSWKTPKNAQPGAFAFLPIEPRNNHGKINPGSSQGAVDEPLHQHAILAFDHPFNLPDSHCEKLDFVGHMPELHLGLVHIVDRLQHDVALA